jgi:hypothetical protein
MKKYIFYLFSFLVLSAAGYGQQSQTGSPAAPAQFKSAAQVKLAYNSTTGGNVFTTGIVNRIATPLALTASQQKSANTALYNFFVEKNGLNKLKFSDPASYQQQNDALVQKLVGQLGTFLSSGQVDQFVAMKPASRRTRDPLAMVFY